MNIKKLTDIFNSECNYQKINTIGNVKMRNVYNGIQLSDLLYYRFLYSKKETTKEQNTSYINSLNNTQFTRQAYDAKENNIPIKIYENILSKILELYNNSYNNDKVKIIAIDGTYSNDYNIKKSLNMGFYDIENNVPIDIKLCSKENNNKEIKCSINYIKKNIDIFRNNIVVCDRGYYSYKFLNFLISNNIQFIVRARGNANNLTNGNVIRGNYDNNEILNIQNNVRIINYGNIMKKEIYITNTKKNMKSHLIEIKNNCTLITNLPNDSDYNDGHILDLYKRRWDIEVYFKYLKYNFKFQYMTEKSTIQWEKLYICELILTYIMKFVDRYYFNKYKKDFEYKVNKSHLVKGITDNLLYKILKNKITSQSINRFTKLYIKITRNKKDRSFPRTSKTPFIKWYIKGYSDHTKFMRIINAILDKKVDKLDKNLKVIANRILSIDGLKV